ncbi:olfactory receptor 5AR1-like [Rhinophrynus dorsalis]
MTGFYIQGLTDVPELQVPLCIAFLLIYFIILFGNVIISIVVLWDSHLHTPMYIFIINLSFLDITYTADIFPNLLYMLFTQRKTISFVGCIIQMYFFVSLTCTEVLLLAAMAYDRYVAICHPLHYALLMSLKLSIFLSIGTWSFGFLGLIGHATLISKLTYCASHLINHFFCDVTSLLKLSCSDTINIEILNYIEGTIFGLTSFMLILISYVFIISTVLNIKSSEGRHKAFSTCTAHLTSVMIFYGTIICLYMRPTSNYSPKQDKFFALLYIVLVPILNPVIYSLKNLEVKDALRKFMSHGACYGKHEDLTTGH